jgi:hypothetical protein
MKKGWIILLLVLIVLAVFVMKPDLLGGGGDAPLLNIGVVQEDVTLIPTDIPCDNKQDCVDFALLQDPDAFDVRATCDGTCTFVSTDILMEAVE